MKVFIIFQFFSFQSRERPKGVSRLMAETVIREYLEMSVAAESVTFDSKIISAEIEYLRP